jgi:hypothetical protein
MLDRVRSEQAQSGRLHLAADGSGPRFR